LLSDQIVISCQFYVPNPALIHGLAGWFDILCEGSDTAIGFSTSPWCSPTHWYQIRFLLQRPVAVNPGQILLCTLTMEANAHQSYYIRIRLQIAGTNIISESAVIDLKDPDYRYYTNPTGSFYPPQPQAVQSTQATSKPENWSYMTDASKGNWGEAAEQYGGQTDFNGST